MSDVNFTTKAPSKTYEAHYSRVMVGEGSSKLSVEELRDATPGISHMVGDSVELASPSSGALIAFLVDLQDGAHLMVVGSDPQGKAQPTPLDFNLGPLRDDTLKTIEGRLTDGKGKCVPLQELRLSQLQVDGRSGPVNQGLQVVPSGHALEPDQILYVGAKGEISHPPDPIPKELPLDCEPW